MKSDTEIGSYLQNLRKERKMSLREVAEHIGIDVSMLSKIEHGERHVQGHMLKPLAELFSLDFKELQIQFLNQRIEEEYGDNPYFIETINFISSKNKNK